MFGLAKKLFLDVTGISLKTFTKHSEWPLLEKALNHGLLCHTEFEMAKRLLRSTSQENESIAALICHLALASKKGHLCVHVAEDKINPTVEELWVSNERLPCTSELSNFYERISKQILLASKDVSLSPICTYQNYYYLPRYWKIENDFIHHFCKMILDNMPEIQLDSQIIEKKIAILQEKEVLPEQALAIYQGCINCLTIVIGGPGTGKTYTASLLIRILWECLPEEVKKQFKIVLAAPTGKAAAHLESSIKKAFQSTDEIPQLTARTLHALLGRKKNSPTVIPADILLVDECSMIDAELMATLMRSLKPGTRLIMLGDKHQLPPVEAGSLFSDIVEVLTSSSYKARVIELKTCLRVELEGILQLAKGINTGCIETVQRTLEFSQAKKGVTFIPLELSQRPKELQQQLLAYCRPKFPALQYNSHNPLEALRAFSQFRLLTPMRKGPYGLEALNALFFEEACKQGINSEYLIFPIIIEKNDYRTGLLNGEIGLLIKSKQGATWIKNEFSKNDFAVFAEKSSNELRKIPALFLTKFSFAYCLSIHKSQGSEFDHVLILLPEGSEQFGREALYTAVTRAKKQVEIWGTMEEIKRMVRGRSFRSSGIANKINL